MPFPLSYRPFPLLPITSCCLPSALGFSNFKFPGFESALYQNQGGSRLFCPRSAQEIKQSRACSQFDRPQVRERGLQIFPQFGFGTRASVFNSESPARPGKPKRSCRHAERRGAQRRHLLPRGGGGPRGGRGLGSTHSHTLT